MPGHLCVIYNPTAGKGRALHRLGRLRRTLADVADFRPSRAPGEAEELALAAAREGFAVVGAAGGDGTAHEVGNGLLRSGRSDVVLAVLPLGSANDYAYSLGLSPDWWLRRDPTVAVRLVDVGLVRSSGRQRHFVNGLGLGLNGAVTLESRRLKGLQGLALYGLALLRAWIFHFRAVPMEVQLDDEARSVPTLLLSLALGQREGNFVVAPHARLDDGLFDYVHAGPISRTQLLGYVPGLVAGKLPEVHPGVWMGRCRRVRLKSAEPLTVHIDGEFFCVPRDAVRELEVECLPAALRVFRRRFGLGGSPVGP
jgi:diacylglycerol kinase family enzyme